MPSQAGAAIGLFHLRLPTGGCPYLIPLKARILFRPLDSSTVPHNIPFFVVATGNSQTLGFTSISPTSCLPAFRNISSVSGALALFNEFIRFSRIFCNYEYRQFFQETGFVYLFLCNVYLVRDINSPIYFHQSTNIFLMKFSVMIISMTLWNAYWCPLKI